MEQAVFRLRSPTSAAWFSTITLVIVTGELYAELIKPGSAWLFRHRVSDAVLGPIVLALAVAALAAFTWLVALYVRPGLLVIDASRGVMRRRERRFVRSRDVEAPFDAWGVKLDYFSATDRETGRFKRIELDSPLRREVILFGDLAEGEALARALTAVGERLGRFDVHVERP